MSLTMKRIEMKGIQRAGIAVVCAAVLLATCATAMALRLEIGTRFMAVAAAGGDCVTQTPKWT